MLREPGAFDAGNVIRPMKSFFLPNINKSGRILRGLIAVALLVAAQYCQTAWLAGILTGAGVVGIFEAMRGWCFLRACGIKLPF